MIMNFKYSVSSYVIWEGKKCMVNGIHINKDGTYKYHLKIVNREKEGIFQANENQIENFEIKRGK